MADLPRTSERPRTRQTGVLPPLSATVTPVSEAEEGSGTGRLFPEDAPTLSFTGSPSSLARAYGRAPEERDLPAAGAEGPEPGRGATGREPSGIHELGFVDGDELRTDPWSIAREAAAATPTDDRDVVDGRYRIERLLGQGGMAQTFLVSHVGLGKPFALKALHGTLARQRQMRDFFYQEAQLASQLDHPNIVQVTDYGENDALGPYLVMELLIGQTLRQRMRGRGPFRVSRALDFTLQVADALRYMHGQGIIHRDVKPDNLFVCDPARQVLRRPILKLMDFGLARREALGAQLSRTELLGTPVYMAPEQLLRAPPQASMDIYALGALLYELLTGRPPFTGPVESVVEAKASRAPEPPSRVGMELASEAVDHLVMKALAREPSHRHPTMAHFIFELRTVMTMLGLRPLEDGLADPEAALAATTALEQGWQAFEACPFPQFTLTPGGRLLAGNAAFGAFLGSPVESLRGSPLGESRLDAIYPRLSEDVQTSMARAAPVQREIDLALRDGSRTGLTVWLVPLRNDAGVFVSCAGLIVPRAG